ncbi:myosin light chain kinase, smooth muscle isoform X2 [Eurytemora carolleeae]|uniref:myosin light chain kinase, smooth muscle isoform X2 n=1 Tax=Eurytemora carolleeae TaxID=1294199 RepID=UPI000C783503|nr:myosin light chain kinase, smooth muscle isoform X2 [Eurytemora carolleeae]|eukprot:XP_023322936.1 myosin light chain kinase, smooth muscle-like isoform X2 [Eurytemora affinis]
MKDASIFDLFYKKREEVGRGKFGVVSRVTGNNGKDYAAKFVRVRNQKIRTSTEKEINILSQLSNPHIIRYVDSFEGLAEIIIVLEYLEGRELFERVASDSFHLTETDCCLFLRQICRGAEYLHSRNILHLDLKEGCSIKIVDFGTALQTSPGEKIQVMCGTPEFVAPEIIAYDFVSSATDMWAIGVITYILLSGFSPFMGESDAETFKHISSVDYDFNVREFNIISADAKDFIRRLLVKNRRHRLSASQCLEHPWLLQENMNEAVISTANLKRYLARMRWQRCGQAIRAMKRVSSLILERRASRTFTLDSQGSEVYTESLRDSVNSDLTISSENQREVKEEFTPFTRNNEIKTLENCIVPIRRTGIDKSALLREEDNTTEDNQTELNKERKRGKTTGKVKHLVKCFENIL